MSKAPDTRGKLDSQRDLAPIKVKLKSATSPRGMSLGTLKKNHAKKAKQEIRDKSPLKIVVEKKESKGSLFKKKFGYSKSMKRAMQKHDLDPNAYSDSLNEYRAIRRKRKLLARKAKQKKHADSAAYRRAHGKARTAKGKTPAPKKVAVAA